MTNHTPPITPRTGFKTKLAAAVVGLMLIPGIASAFCGFFVSKADTQLFNQASKVVIARHDQKTVLTMVNDYEGPLKDFAMVVPVPTFITEKQIHVTENKIVDHLDAYTSPRLVEYHDSDPCRVRYDRAEVMSAPMASGMLSKSRAKKKANALGVTIEAEYTVGEYDIMLLSAKESGGLRTWLNTNGYKIPAGAGQILNSYIKQGVRFFVAKVNLDEQSKVGSKFLRPLQVAYKSQKFMLPIRLGTVNAKGPQELFIFALTKNGRVETTNYRTVKIESNMDIPVYIKNEFGNFYKAMFDTQTKKEGNRAVFLEYAWNMANCDPCAADPLSRKELQELGVFWQNGYGNVKPMPMPRRRRFAPPRAQNVFVTRLHVRYDANHFPEDLRFQETGDRSNFQGRYVLRHPWTGQASCPAGERYKKSLPARFEKESTTLAHLTGWDLADIQSKMAKNGQSFGHNSSKPTEEKPWYMNLWW